MSKCSRDFSKVDVFIKKFRFKYLLYGSKETTLGFYLTGLFPSVVIYIFVYTLLLSDIIPEFEITFYMHGIFIFSGFFLAVYSFFNEVLYDSSDDMRITVIKNTVGMFLGSFISPKNPL